MAKKTGKATTAAPDASSQVTDTPPEKRTKVAIVGFAGSSLHQAPVNDPSWEIWGLNQLWRQLPRWDVWFDMHPLSHTITVPGHFDWLKQQTKPIIMLDRTPKIPASVPYPKHEILTFFESNFASGRYFTSSIAWMLGLAIARQYPTIGVWGVDMLGDSEYAFQRACCDYYIGIAKGMGLDVVLPKDSALCRGQDLYGYDYVETFSKRRMTRLRKRNRSLSEQKDRVLKDLCNIDGAIREVMEWTQAGHDEEWKQNRLLFLRQQREDLNRSLYTVDGALQEVSESAHYEKHYLRGGA